MDEITIDSWKPIYTSASESLYYLDVKGGRLYQLVSIDPERVVTKSMTFAPLG